jgi:hypothetical protein
MACQIDRLAHFVEIGIQAGEHPPNQCVPKSEGGGGEGVGNGLL